MPDVVDRSLATLTAARIEESAEELLASAQEQLDRAATEARRLSGNVEPQLLTIIGRLAAAILAAHRDGGKEIELGEVAGEIRDATAMVGNSPDPQVGTRLTYTYVHKALVELHRRSGRFTRLRDGGSLLELTDDASYLAGVIVKAIDSGRFNLTVSPA
jgi:signal transduction histidine kinase